MTQYGYLHEAEDVWLVANEPRECEELWSLLNQLGFALDEDVFVLDREGEIPSWQSRAIVSVYVIHNETEVYDEDEKWDKLKLRYLLATLPSECVLTFVERVCDLSIRLALPMIYNGDEVTRSGLQAKLKECVRELGESVGEPGSEGVAVFIESTYPR